MVFTPTPIPGVHLIELVPLVDERGFFAVGLSRDAFIAYGLNPQVEQVNLSYNALRGTLRGLHYQEAPYDEAKVVRCVRGGAYDVAVDLRPDSPTYCQWFGVELNAKNRRAMYIPIGVAHGFQTLADDTEVLYTVSQPYSQAHSRGVRWNDPRFEIRWPEESRRTMHPRDRDYPDYVRARVASPKET